MNFIELTTIADQTLVITPRYAGQVIRLDGVGTVTQAEVPVRVRGSGVVEISEGYWDDLMIVAGRSSEPYFDGSTIPADNEVERFSWSGAPNESPSIREVRTLEQRPQTDEEYAAALAPYRRFLHDVAATSGPLDVDIFESKATRGIWGAVMEWTITSERPWIYSTTREVNLPITPTVVIQDTPFNLAPYPSAELAGPAVVAATNYSLNPSLEENATGWAYTSTAVTGSNPGAFTTAGRVTGELQAIGTSSYRVRLLGSGTTASGRADLQALHRVDISGRPAGSRVSFSVWAAILSLAGGASTVLVSLGARVDWRTSAGAFISASSIETVTDRLGGHAFEAKSLQPPANAASAEVVILGRADWVSGATNSDIRLYVDALAVTVP